MKTRDILDLKIESSDFDKDFTIGDYFKNLLLTLWNEGENFSGKRPFGNSSWEYDIYKPLIKARIIEGKLDEYGGVDDVDIYRADEVIFELIDAIFLMKTEF